MHLAREERGGDQDEDSAGLRPAGRRGVPRQEEMKAGEEVAQRLACPCRWTQGTPKADHHCRTQIPMRSYDTALVHAVDAPCQVNRIITTQIHNCTHTYYINPP